MSLDSKLMIKRIRLQRDKIESFDVYPFNIDVVRNFEELNFENLNHHFAFQILQINF